MKKQLNKDALEALLVRVPVMIFSFLHSIFLIRMLGPEGNGLYAFISASISLCTIVVGFDVKNSTLFHLIKKDFDSPKVMGITFIFYLGSILLIGILTLMIVLFESNFSYFFIPQDHFVHFYAFYFFVSFSFLHLTTLCHTILQAEKAFRKLNIHLFYTNLLQVIVYGFTYLLVTQFEFASLSVQKIFTIILMLQALAFIWALYLVRRAYQKGVDYKFGAVRKSFITYSKLGFINRIGHFFNKRLDVWFVEFFTGLKNLGLYALSSQLTNFLLLFTVPVEQVINSYLIELDRDEGNKIFTTYFSLILYMVTGASISLFLLGPYIITVLFGIEFKGAILPLRILCLGVVFVSVRRMLSNYNRAHNYLKYNIWAQWSGVAVTLVLDLILIPSYGIIGAAWASVIAYAQSAVILLILFLKGQKVHFRNLFRISIGEWKALLK